MFRRLLETIKELILLFILVSVGSALIDYGRITGGEMPLFCIKSFDPETKIESFRGIFYQASRKVNISPDENMYESSQIKYYVLTKKISVPSVFKNQEFKYTLNTEEASDCHTSLYYSDENTKLYTYCLDSVKLKEAGSETDMELVDYLNNDSTLVEDIVSNVPYRGLYKDNETLYFKTTNHNFVNNGLAIYRCHTSGNNSIYIGPENMEYHNFC